MKTPTIARRPLPALLIAFAACSGVSAHDMSAARGARQADGGPATSVATPAPRAELALAAGTTLVLQSGAEITSRRDRAGERIQAIAGAAAVGALGDTLIPAGATFEGRVVAIAHAPRPGQPGVLKLAFDEVRFDGRRYPVRGEVTSLATELRGRGVTAGTAAKVGAGAVIGGIAGRLIGGNGTGTVVGAVAGGAGGAVVANATRTMDVVLPAGAAIRFRLAEPFVREAAAGN